MTLEMKQFALVVGDHIESVGPFEAEKPEDGRVWLPVVSEDSQPFDSELHWRLAPTYRVEADRVVRTYSVVPKVETAQ